MLSKDPMRRPQTPRELIEILARLEIETFSERVRRVSEKVDSGLGVVEQIMIHATGDGSLGVGEQIAIFPRFCLRGYSYFFGH